MAQYSELVMQIDADNKAREQAERKAKEAAYELRMKKLAEETEKAMKQKAAEPPKGVEEFDLMNEEPVTRSGKHFMTVRRSRETGNPVFYYVKEIENKDRVSFAVSASNQFDAFEQARQLLFNRVHKAGVRAVDAVLTH